MSEYRKLRDAYLQAIDCSEWLTNAVNELDKRDIEDSLHDIEALTQIFTEKWNELPNK